MLSKTIEVLKYLLLEYRFYFFSIALLFVLFIYSHNETVTLEKELTLWLPFQKSSFYGLIPNGYANKKEIVSKGCTSGASF